MLHDTIILHAPFSNRLFEMQKMPRSKQLRCCSVDCQLQMAAVLMPPSSLRAMARLPTLMQVSSIRSIFFLFHLLLRQINFQLSYCANIIYDPRRSCHGTREDGKKSRQAREKDHGSRAVWMYISDNICKKYIFKFSSIFS